MKRDGRERSLDSEARADRRLAGTKRTSNAFAVMLLLFRFLFRRFRSLLLLNAGRSERGGYWRVVL